MKIEKLNEAIRLHSLWLAGDSTGKRLDLRYANLRSADLSSANLSSADLSSADLRYANLSSADLSSANLSSADLSSADLRYANLSSADLSYADLSSADLRYANLSSADLSYADLSYADLRSAKLRDEIPIIPNIDAAILAAIETPGNKLNMNDWHTCQTTHCRAGWAITLAGATGKALEKKYGPNAAGSLIYAKSRPGVRVPYFMDSNEGCMADLRKCAAS